MNQYKRTKPCDQRRRKGAVTAPTIRGGQEPFIADASSRGFYDEALSKEDALDLLAARTIEGLDEEIALLRVRIKRIARDNADNAALLLKALEALSKALVTRHRISGEARGGLDAALSQALTELANELGLPL